MEISNEHKKEFEKIKLKVSCPKDIQCYKSGLKKLPDTKLIGDGKLVECCEEQCSVCQYGLAFGFGTVCKCPIRNYIAMHFRI